MNVCCGGIVGMGESLRDRARMLQILANLPQHPESVPINRLVRVPGDAAGTRQAVDPFDFVRTIAVARIMMPRAYVRLSAGREEMSDELQALCFLAGANSIFYGEKLLTTGNPDVARDRAACGGSGLQAERPRGVWRGCADSRRWCANSKRWRALANRDAAAATLLRRLLERRICGAVQRHAERAVDGRT